VSNNVGTLTTAIGLFGMVRLSALVLDAVAQLEATR
jgi:hypothetical protein